MALRRITQLPLDNAVTGPDVVPIVSDGATKRVRLSTLATFFATATGPTGAASSVTGPAGAVGDVGPTGPQGISVVGPTGPAGQNSTVPGPTGPQGVAGGDGPTGPAGNSIVGPTGPSGIAGGVGPTGPAGAAGSLGPTGPAGVVAATAPVTYDAGTQTVALAVGAGLATSSGSLVLAAHKSTHATGGSDALSPSDIGAAAVSHTHSALDLTSGTVDIARLPVGQTSTTVAAGNDARFTDQRVPTDGSVTDAKIATAGLSASSINWVAIADWQPSTSYAKGDLVSYLGVAYRRSAAGTSGTTFSASNWQQVTPSEFVGSQITSGTVAAARLGSGTPSASNYLRGDGAWSAVTASAAAVYEFTRSSKPADATGSNGSYSMSLPSGAKLVEILAIGSGGGGGSGRRGAAGSARWGGGGGAGANATLVTIPASLITTGLDVAVAAGGAGGAAVTADDTNGNPGTGGGQSSVTFNGVSFVRGIGGTGGAGGTATSGGGGSVNNTDMRTFAGVNGGASSATGNGNATFPGTGNAGMGGAGGGGISTGNVAYTGGTVWNPASFAGIVVAAGSTVVGGAASTTAAAGAGANGATYGYGGSGGGASANGNNSGAGGNGGEGYVRITVWS